MAETGTEVRCGQVTKKDVRTIVLEIRGGMFSLALSLLVKERNKLRSKTLSIFTLNFI